MEDKLNKLEKAIIILNNKITTLADTQNNLINENIKLKKNNEKIKTRILALENKEEENISKPFELIILSNTDDDFVLLGLNNDNKIISVIKLYKLQFKQLIKEMQNKLSHGKNIMSFKNYDFYDKFAYFKNNSWFIE